METIDLHQFPPKFHGPLTLAIGNFDGIHYAHKELFKLGRKMALSNNTDFGVMLFDPHPKKFFQPDIESFQLTLLQDKLIEFEELKIDKVFIVPFKKIKDILAYDFCKQILVDGLKISHLVVGFDFCFGKKREGNTKTLRNFESNGLFKLSVVDPVFAGVKIEYSSSLIREKIKNGEMQNVKKLLGRLWTVRGVVVDGERRGASIGYPTANVILKDYIHPMKGVYAVEIFFDGNFFTGIANFGIRPTFGQNSPILEVHIFDYKGDLYGNEISIAFVDFIRSEKKFKNVDDLKKQILYDCDKAKNILGKKSLSL